MFGGQGNDVYLVDNIADSAVEVAGEGSDGIYTTVSYTLGAGADIETLSTLDWNGTAAIDLAGNEISNWLIGNAGVNQLRGLGGNDIIEAKGGDDSLDGGAGADVMVGGTGNDVYLVDDQGDAAIEAAGQGNDGIYTTVSYMLADGTDVETLSTLDWAGTAAINLTGNNLANWLIGNAGANVLNGGAGADILQGKGGNDVYVVDNGGDLILENAGEGSDAVYVTASYALNSGAEVESLSTLDWGSSAAINLAGNEFGNYMIGNAGANTLDGKGGYDALVGREGADTFAFTTALGATNVDHIADMVSGTDKIALDHAVFTGLGPGALNANAFVTGSGAGDADDRIIYNSATGELFFDADGNGSGAAVLFAVLDGHPVLAASDFNVI
jgi:Ca2+-binding RTX toxin-like protein